MPMPLSVNPVSGQTTNRRAVCGKSACTVRREGRLEPTSLSYPYLAIVRLRSDPLRSLTAMPFAACREAAGIFGCGRRPRWLTATQRTFLEVGASRLCQECPAGSACPTNDTRSPSGIAENWRMKACQSLRLFLSATLLVQWTHFQKSPPGRG